MEKLIKKILLPFILIFMLGSCSVSYNTKQETTGDNVIENSTKDMEKIREDNKIIDKSAYYDVNIIDTYALITN